jgi:hypothetical protein
MQSRRMTMTTYRITVNGSDYGIYEGNDEDEALDAMAADAGYGGFSAMCRSLGMDVRGTRRYYSVRKVQS